MLPADVLRLTAKPAIVRNLETARDPAGRVWDLYLTVDRPSASDARPDPCLDAVENGVYWGGVCPGGSDLVSHASYADWAMGGRVLVGIAGDATTAVRIVDVGGKSHSLPLSPGKSFIYFCPASCGCAVAEVISDAPGQPPSVDVWREPHPRRPSSCRG